MAATKRQMKFAVFMSGDSHYHMAGWRHPGAYADGGLNFKHWAEFARTMERGKLDMLFIADTIGTPGSDDREQLSFTSKIDRFEPLTVLSALSQVTQRLGLAATAATTYSAPYTVARMFASLDYLTDGRAGWNLVTGGNREDALNFNLDTHVPHAERYALAEEFADVVRGLWDSYEDDAFLRDKSSGRYFRPEKLHVLNHKGKYFSVKGPLSVARPPQGHPVIIQAGGSVPSKELSARVADVMFMSQSDLGEAKAFYQDVKGRVEKFGRKPDDLKLMPGAFIFVGRSEAEANERFEELEAMVPIEVAMARLSQNLGGVDLSGYPLDGPMPEVKGNSARMSAPDSYMKIARRENLTLRQTARRAATAKHHWIVKGTPGQIADQLEDWFVNFGADGFNLLPPYLPGSLNDFVDLVIPELQKRGLFRTEYEGKTLRENLGVPRPEHRAVRAAAIREDAPAAANI
jgi:FMN-dependent oxidoreductase (nitrilotriacetate monooxygenase family)